MNNFLHFPSLNSTNTYLKENYASLSHGTVVQADEQTNGRGRYARNWVSTKGGLYFSVLIKPSTTNYLANLTQLMALSVVKALAQLKVKANLKWPNDVQVNNKKICGILSEVIVSSDTVQAVIIGVGINVSQKTISKVGQPAITLKELGVQISTRAVLDLVLDYFWKKYPLMLAEGFKSIRHEYKEDFLALGKEVTIKNEEKSIKGIAIDISENGTLILQTDIGPQEIYIGDLIV